MTSALHAGGRRQGYLWRSRPGGEAHAARACEADSTAVCEIQEGLTGDGAGAFEGVGG